MGKRSRKSASVEPERLARPWTTTLDPLSNSDIWQALLPDQIKKVMKESRDGEKEQRRRGRTRETKESVHYRPATPASWV